MGLKLAAPNREISLSKFGGLFTEADARDLPAGASPRCHDIDFTISGFTIRPGLSRSLSAFSPTPSPTSNWLYVKSTSLLGQLNETLAQNSDGSLWLENLAAAGTLTRFYTGILNNARAISANISKREYICLSDLFHGNDQPRQWDGTNLDRISQVGPGAGPSTPSVTGTVYTISTITQPYSAHTIDSISWGSSINLYTASPTGTNLYFLSAVGGSTFFTGINVGDYIYVSGSGTLEGINPNGTYAVVSKGSYTDQDGTRQYIQVTADQANSDFARGTAGGTLQKTQAVVQLSVPVPAQNAQIGTQIAIAGSSVQQWNATWKIIDTPNEGQLSISATSLASNIATYDYSVTSGNGPGWQSAHVYNAGSQIVDSNGSGHVWEVTTPGTSGGSSPAFPASPAPGATITDGTGSTQITWTYQSGAALTATVFNTSNGNGIFNIQSKPILSATSTTFTVAITSANVTSAAEIGEAVSGSGSVLIIDPGTITAGSGNPGDNPIYGNATGGEVLPQSSQVAAGERYAILMFLTRSGYLTPASPPVVFYTTGQSTSFQFTNLAIGPPNVIARVIAITAANAGIGGPYYYIPDDVTVASSASTLGLTTRVTKTIVEDNTSTTSPTFTITDAVLINSVDVTAVGNNRLQVRELAECTKVVQFKGRAFYIGERVKVDQFVNMSWDGGKLTNGAPAGWTTNIPFEQTFFVQKKWQYVRTTTSSFTITLGSTPTVGNTLVVAVGGDANSNWGPAFPTSPSGWTSLGSKNSTGSEASGVLIGYRAVQAGDTATLTFPGTTLFPQDAFVAAWELQGTPTITGAAGDNTGAPGGTIPTAVISPPANSFVLLMYVLGGAITFTSVSPSPYVFENTTIGASPVSAMNADAGAASFPSSAVTANYTGSPASTGLWAYATGIAAGGFFGQIVNSPIVNTSLELTNGSAGVINPTGTALANVLMLAQAAFENAFGTAIIQPNTAYSVRVTAANLSGATSGTLVLELYSASENVAYQFTVPLTSMSASVQEFIGPLNNPLWGTVPSDLQFRVYPQNMPVGTVLLVDRIEVYPTATPYYDNQAAVSYAEDYESIDGVTGIVSTFQYTTEPIRNLSNFVEDELLIATTARTFAPSPTDDEPSGWLVKELSDQAGACGPMTQDGGPEYRLTADYHGLWLFDGGNHIKVTQEIQHIWNALYKPSLDTIWVKNDIGNQRFMVGVPLPTPNQWLPNAPTNAAPATPNVVLMCSYLMDRNGGEIAAGQPIHVSVFTGAMLWKDMDRKWTIWQIKAPTGDWIDRPDGSKEFWLGGTGTGQIYKLDNTIFTDDGAVIDETYIPYCFADAKDEETLQLGSVRKLYDYAAVLIEGAGAFNVTMYPETLSTPYFDTQPNFTLVNPALDDTNIPLNETGNRLFVKFHVDGNAGSYFNMRRIVMACQPDPRILVRGWNG